LKPYLRMSTISIFFLITSFWLNAAELSGKEKDPSKEDALQVQEILNSMTLEEKVAQMFCGFLDGYFINEGQSALEAKISLVEDFKIGGFMLYRGTPYSQRQIIEKLQEHARIPLLFSQDLEWGAGMRIEHTTRFPSMMALGATRDPDLVYAMARAIAEEVKAMGIQQSYAPVADINNNPGNPIVNVRSFGETPELVTSMVTAYVRGLQDGGVMATAKHFPGHGDTQVDSHKGLPILNFDEKRLFSLELKPFQALIEQGVDSIMMGHLSLPSLIDEKGVPASLSPEIVTGLLRNKLGFKGLIVTDAMQMSGVTECCGVREASVRAVKAGNDVLLMSPDPRSGRAAILDAVREGELDPAQIDTAVRHILTAKIKAGLFNSTQKDNAFDQIFKDVATPENLALASRIARKSVTLLQNDNRLIPILKDPGKVVCVTLSDTDAPNVSRPFLRALERRVSNQLQTFLVDLRTQKSEYKDILSAVKHADLVLIPCYFKVRAWSGKIGLSPESGEFLNHLIKKSERSMVLTFGNPYILEGISHPQAFLTCYSSEPATQDVMVQAIFGESDIGGKLPVTLPGSHSFGEGMNIKQQCLRIGKPEEAGFSPDLPVKIRKRIEQAIDEKVFPAAAVAVGRNGVLVLNQGYGYLTYDSETRVTPRSRFDLASITKIVATTSSVMKLIGEGKLSLSDKVTRFFPGFGQGGKEDIRIEHLLHHTSGLKPFISFLRKGIKGRKAIQDVIFSQVITRKPGTKSVYSDLNMITLGWIVEKVTGRNLNDYARHNLWDPMGMKHTGFLPAGKEFPGDIFVPTEIDKKYRGGLIQGAVHDGTSFMLGGIAGHAGVFSTSTDLAKFAFMLLNGGKIRGNKILEPSIIELFRHRKTFPSGEDRGLGWDIKSLEGVSASGSLAGPNTYGHLGFTGTSIWIDPDSRAFVILLTNRVYPSRTEHRHRQVRSDISDLVFGSIIQPPKQAIEKPGKREENEETRRDTH